MYTRRVLRIILSPIITVTAEKQDIHPPPIRIFILHANERGRFNEGPVLVVPVEDLVGAADQVVAVCGGDLLDHDGSGFDGGNSVSARAAIADVVAVNFVDYVLAAVGVLEAGGVDDAALPKRGDGMLALEILEMTEEGAYLLEVTSEYLILCRIGAGRGVRSSGADAVNRWIFLRLSGVVHDIRSTGLDTDTSAQAPAISLDRSTHQTNYMRSPDCLPGTPLPHIRKSIIILHFPLQRVIRYGNRDVVSTALRRESIVFPIRLDKRRIREVLRNNRGDRYPAFNEGRCGGEQSQRSEHEGQGCE